jgi:plasmid stabilization system protein ParE
VKLGWTDGAIEDLQPAYEYLAAENEKAAETADRIVSAVERLVQFPQWAHRPRRRNPRASRHRNAVYSCLSLETRLHSNPRHPARHPQMAKEILGTNTSFVIPTRERSETGGICCRFRKLKMRLAFSP